MGHRTAVNPRQCSQSAATARCNSGVSSERVDHFWSHIQAPKQTKRPDSSGLSFGRANGIRTRVTAVKAKSKDSSSGGTLYRP